LKEHSKKINKHGSPLKRRLFPSKKPYVIGLVIMGIVTICLLLMMIVMDILPADLTIILTAVMMGLLLLTCILFASRHRATRAIGIVIAALFIVAAASMTNFMGSTYAMLNKISGGASSATGPAADRADVANEPFNVYITGIDQWESEKGLDLERSDVNMLVTVNPVTKKILLTSIPRDSYVKLHTAQQMDKLTHTGIYGVDETLNTVEDWLGVEINYYVKMNFTGAKDMINAIDGINVYSPVAFESSLKGYKYKKGWNAMGGSKALYFVRERHAFEGQDAVRVENQQRVMKAIIKKMTSKKTLITHYGDILKAAGNNLATNMPADDMKDLAKMQITDMAEWDVQTQKMTGDYDMDYVASLSSANTYSIYRVSPESLRQNVDGIRAVMNPTASELKDAGGKNTKSFVINYIRHFAEKLGDSE